MLTPTLFRDHAAAEHDGIEHPAALAVPFLSIPQTSLSARLHECNSLQGLSWRHGDEAVMLLSCTRMFGYPVRDQACDRRTNARGPSRAHGLSFVQNYPFPTHIFRHQRSPPQPGTDSSRTPMSITAVF
jgi:hypothetical protein